MKTMKTTKTLSNLFMILLVLLLSFGFVGCDDNSGSNEDNYDTPADTPDVDQDKVDFVIELIDLFGTISLRKKDEVEYANNLYNELNESEKALVTNYETLKAALNTIDYLENEDKYIKIGYENCINYLNELVPSNILDGVYSIELPTRYEYNNDYKSYIFILTWASSNPRVLNSTGSVYHMVEDKNVDITCKIECLVIDEDATFSKAIKVDMKPTSSVSSPVVTSYLYGEYKGFNSIDVNTISIVNYSFAQIASRTEGSKTVYYIDCRGVPSIDKITELHQYGIKVCLSLGGWHTDMTFWDTYRNASSTEENRKMVANSILEVMEKYQLDGIDMDWEYPQDGDKNNFTLLIKEISETLKAKDPGYIISAAVPCGSWATVRYDYRELNKYMDYFYIMSYDLDDDGSGITKHLTDLYTCKYGAQVLVSAGVDKKKVVFGIAFYGRLFRGVANTNHGFNQPYESKSSITYQRIVDEYLNRVGTDCTIYYDSTYLAYYLYDTKNNALVSFDTVESCKAKYNYSIEADIGGVMYWSYNDDTTGTMMKALSEAKEAYLATLNN